MARFANRDYGIMALHCQLPSILSILSILSKKTSKRMALHGAVREPGLRDHGVAWRGSRTGTTGIVALHCQLPSILSILSKKTSKRMALHCAVREPIYGIMALQ
jgi:hypothetical protein